MDSKVMAQLAYKKPHLQFLNIDQYTKNIPSIEMGKHPNEVAFPSLREVKVELLNSIF